MGTFYAKPNDVDFDYPFKVLPDGVIVDAAPGIHAPSVYHVEGASHPDDIEIDGKGDWEALHGYTGQYSYRGAVMHPSEYIGGRLEDDIMATPGTYVVTEVRDLSEEESSDDPIGWVVLRLKV